MTPAEMWERDSTPEQKAWVASLPTVPGLLPDDPDQPDFLARIDEPARYSPRHIRDWWTFGNREDRYFVDHLLAEQQRELDEWQRTMFRF